LFCVSAIGKMFMINQSKWYQVSVEKTGSGFWVLGSGEYKSRP